MILTSACEETIAPKRIRQMYAQAIREDQRVVNLKTKINVTNKLIKEVNSNQECSTMTYERNSLVRDKQSNSKKYIRNSNQLIVRMQ